MNIKHFYSDACKASFSLLPEVMRIAFLLIMVLLPAHNFVCAAFVPFLPIVYYAIAKERDEEKDLQEIEDKFLQKKRNSPSVRYTLLTWT